MILLAGESFEGVKVGLSLIDDHIHLLYLVLVILNGSLLAAVLLLCIYPMEDRVSRTEKP